MNPPHALLALTDAPRAIVDMTVLRVASPLLDRMPRPGYRHSVMVLPGFMGSDVGNQPLINYLRRLGYNARGWKQGRNLGTSSFSEDRLRQEMSDLALQGGGTLSLIGHSLGGLYAREIARAEPELVRQVITLGSPFGPGHESGSHAWRLYQRLNPEQPSSERGLALAEPPPVPTTAIFTRADGIVNWRTSKQEGNYPHVHNIEVLGSHIGLNLNVGVWYWLAKKLYEHHWQTH